VEEALALVGPGGKLGLLGTDATLASGLYVNRAAGNDAERRVHWVLPTASEILEQVMPGIAAVKAGQLAQATGLLMAAVLALKQRGADAVVLGCTEIPVVLHAGNTPLAVVDATAALARRAVAWSLAVDSH
jgi:aspartate racemase